MGGDQKVACNVEDFVESRLQTESMMDATVKPVVERTGLKEKEVKDMILARLGAAWKIKQAKYGKNAVIYHSSCLDEILPNREGVNKYLLENEFIEGEVEDAGWAIVLKDPPAFTKAFNIYQKDLFADIPKK